MEFISLITLYQRYVVLSRDKKKKGFTCVIRYVYRMAERLEERIFRDTLYESRGYTHVIAITIDIANVAVVPVTLMNKLIVGYLGNDCRIFKGKREQAFPSLLNRLSLCCLHPMSLLLGPSTITLLWCKSRLSLTDFGKGKLLLKNSRPFTSTISSGKTNSVSFEVK